jgi:transposase
MENSRKKTDLSAMSRKEIEELAVALMDRNEALSAENSWLIEQIKVSKKKMFGQSSESGILAEEEQLSMLMNEPETFSGSDTAEPGLEEARICAPRKKRKGDKKAKIRHLPVKQTDYILSEEDRICKRCGNVLHEMKKEVRDEITYVPPKFYVKRSVRHIYACRSCDTDGTKGTIVRADAPFPLLPNSLASPSLVAHIIDAKYVNALPLYRQEQDLLRNGMRLSRQTLSNWVIKSTQRYLIKIYGKMKEQLIAGDILHADETELEVLSEPGREAKQKSYMWVYRNGNGAKDCVIYEYTPGRSGRYPEKFLEEFSGYLQTDGYSGYGSICRDDDRRAGPIISVGCLAHARRKFTDALAASGGSRPPNICKGISFCDELFRIEKECRDMDPEERKAVRGCREKDILDAYFEWLKKLSSETLPKSMLSQAVNYSLNQEQQLRRYLEDGRLEISNNAAERAIKPFVIGRKNWLFSNTPKGAEASAVIYSIVETAKANGLKPFEYLTHVLEVMSQDSSEDIVESLMPWSEDLPDSCRCQKE